MADDDTKDITEEETTTPTTNEPDEDVKEEVEETETETPDDVVKEKEEELKIETRNLDEEKIDYGEDIDPDDIKTIGSIVDKKTAQVKKQLQETQDRLEVDSFVSEHPEFAKYKPTIMKYIQHPVYNKIPVKNIASMVAANDLIKLGAQKEREAQAKADSTKTAGSPVRREGGSTTDWTKASKDEFEAQRRRVLGQVS